MKSWYAKITDNTCTGGGEEKKLMTRSGPCQEEKLQSIGKHIDVAVER